MTSQDAENVRRDQPAGVRRVFAQRAAKRNVMQLFMTKRKQRLSLVHLAKAGWQRPDALSDRMKQSRDCPEKRQSRVAGKQPEMLQIGHDAVGTVSEQSGWPGHDSGDGRADQTFSAVRRT